jgi:hypothetical protein
VPAPAHDIYLNALVASNKSMEVRTRVFSKSNLDSLLSEHPAAITFSRSGVLDAERLLAVYMKNHALFRPIIQSRHTNQWRCYAQRVDEKQFDLKVVADNRALLKGLVQLLKRVAKYSANAPICALVPALEWTSKHDKEIRSVFCDAIVDTGVDAIVTTGGVTLPIQIKSSPRVTADPIIPPQVRRDEDDVNDREALIRTRRQMLDRVGSFSSEDLAAAAESMTSNPSQFAADQRGTGEIFGVRFGREWRYPRFQFDAKRRAFPEMKPVLRALSPDEQGWDRLQWFLEPHEILRGRTPLEVWKTHRQKVVEAANTERWDGRD